MGREYKWYTCHRCARTIDDYEAFGVGDPTKRVYCKSHIPWWYRLQLILKGY